MRAGHGPRAALVLLTIALAACGGPGQPSSLSPAAPAGEQAAGFPVSMENCGRTLTFTEPPSRVVAGYLPAFETLAALGVGDRLIGRTRATELGADDFLPGQREVYEAVPEISGSIDLPSKEVLLSMDPDLVVEAHYSYSFDAAKGQATIEELNAAGTQVYILGKACDEQGVRDGTPEVLLEDLRNLGRIFGVSEQAGEAVAEAEATLTDVDERVRGLEPVAVLVTDGGAGPVTVHAGSGFFDTIVQRAGGRNVLADVDEDYTEVSAERITATPPEAMLVLDYDNTTQDKIDTVLGLIPDSPAARDRRVLPVLPASYPGYRTFAAIRQIAAFLHPDAFGGAERFLGQAA